MSHQPAFDNVHIIFNPNSTGDAPQLARELHDQLETLEPRLAVRLVETRHAGHAEELARSAAAASHRPLIVSVSGDGGYHEVVNGVLASGNPLATTAVYAAGNANDHRSATREHPLAEAITAGHVVRFDLLKVAVEGGPIRYAHSYAGLGVTSAVAVELNRHALNRFKELQLVFQTFKDLVPFAAVIDSRRVRLDSLIFANTSRMAKVFTLSDAQAPTDGQFEVVVTVHRSKLQLVLTGLRLALRRSAVPPKTSSFSFETVAATPMQLDGELLEVPAHGVVTVTSARGALRTLA